jgi:hypothetical protein
MAAISSILDFCRVATSVYEIFAVLPQLFMHAVLEEIEESKVRLG